jgi:hypothetical protein
MSATRDKVMALGDIVLRTGRLDASARPLLDLAKDGDALAAYFVGRWMCNGDSLRDRAAGVRYLLESARRGFLTSLIFAQSVFDRQNSAIDLLDHTASDGALTEYGIDRKQLPSGAERWDSRFSTFISRVSFLRAAVNAGATSARVRLAVEYIRHSPARQRWVGTIFDHPLTSRALQKFNTSALPTKPAQALLSEELANSLAYGLLHRFYQEGPKGANEELIENSAIANDFTGRPDLLARAHLALIIEHVRIGLPQTISSTMASMTDLSTLLDYAKRIDHDLTSTLPWSFRVPLSHDDVSALILSTRQECSFSLGAMDPTLFSLVAEPNLAIFEDHIIASVLQVTLRIVSYFAAYSRLAPAWRGLFADKSRQQLLSSRYQRVLKGKLRPVGYVVQDESKSSAGSFSGSSSSYFSSIFFYGPLSSFQETKTNKTETFGSAAIYGFPGKIPGSSSYSMKLHFDFGFWFVDDQQMINWIWFLGSFQSGTGRVPTRLPGQVSLPTFEDRVKSRPVGDGLLSDMLKKASDDARCEPIVTDGSEFVRTLAEVRFIHAIDLDRMRT